MKKRKRAKRRERGKKTLSRRSVSTKILEGGFEPIDINYKKRRKATYKEVLTAHQMGLSVRYYDPKAKKFITEKSYKRRLPKNKRRMEKRIFKGRKQINPARLGGVQKAFAGKTIDRPDLKARSMDEFVDRVLLHYAKLRTYEGRRSLKRLHRKKGFKGGRGYRGGTAKMRSQINRRHGIIEDTGD